MRSVGTKDADSNISINSFSVQLQLVIRKVPCWGSRSDFRFLQYLSTTDRSLLLNEESDSEGFNEIASKVPLSKIR